MVVRIVGMIFQELVLKIPLCLRCGKRHDKYGWLLRERVRIMDERMHMYFVLAFLLLLSTLPLSHSQPSDCKDEPPYNCGLLSNISYPFWAGEDQPSPCRSGIPFQLKCDHTDNTTSIYIGSLEFTVKEIDMTLKTMRVVPTDLVRDICSLQIEEDPYESLTPFWYLTSVYNISIFYYCTKDASPSFNFNCEGDEHNIFYKGQVDDLLKQYPRLNHCERHVQVPVDQGVSFKNDTGAEFLKKAFSQGVWLNYNVPNTDNKNSLNWRRKIVVGVASCVMVVFMICIIICCSKCMSSTTGHVKFWFTSDQDIEAFLKNHGAQAQKRYKFSEVKKMTNSFKVKLGGGGFGTVYKGEILGGCPVAVKILNASKGNGVDFINEVASISRTCHVNVVTLLGFCLEGNKKALIYEFMPNGSLDKYIYNKKFETTQLLSWDNLWHISIGIARGLEYLHRGCNTRILHFDIKPHNILLDENFCPKISDFGLAKLCPRKESIISMSDARGTIGYVAPEVWNRNFGGISHKSDVYSYGMMLLEMVGGRKNLNAEASNTSEIYFPYWVYSRLEQGQDLRPDGVMVTEENEIARRMTIVGLWCVQTFPKDRPTMSRVIDMLEGNMNSMEMPPKPLLSTPTRSVPESSTS